MPRTRIRQPSKRPPYRPCVDCGAMGRRLAERCRDCDRDPLALTGGDWVIDTRRRVVVWKEAS